MCQGLNINLIKWWCFQRAFLRNHGWITTLE
uniref:Uncharacterized protein n=1 Tax=Arundo donax TaxID=35708 RepID=A0A0A9FV64_ARUDO